MPDSRTDQIAKLKETIATLEEQQRISGIDLSLSLNQVQELLAQLEQADEVDTHKIIRLNSADPSSSWGTRLNEHDMFNLNRPAKPPKGCPAWATWKQIASWGSRGLVIWNNETQQLCRLAAESALEYLDQLRASNKWQANGIVITPTISRSKPSPLPTHTRKRSRKKQEPIEPPPPLPENEGVEEECVRLGSAASQEFFTHLDLYGSTLRRMAEEDKKDRERVMSEVIEVFLRAAHREQANKVDLAARPLQWIRSEHELKFVCDRAPNRATIKPTVNNYAWQVCIEQPNRFKNESPWLHKLEEALDWAEKEMLAIEQSPTQPQEADEVPTPVSSGMDLTPYWIDPASLEPEKITYRVIMFIEREPVEFKTMEMSFGKMFKYDEEFPGPQALARELYIDPAQMTVRQISSFLGLYEVQSTVTYYKESLAIAQAQLAWEQSKIVKAFQEGKIISAYYGYEEVETGYEAYLGGCQKPEATKHESLSRNEYLAEQAMYHTLLNALDIDRFRAHLGFKTKIVTDEKLLVRMHEERVEATCIPQAARFESQQWLTKNAGLVKELTRQKHNR